jgi:CheY-like chemotaxis protein
VLLNLLGNAIKFTAAGEVRLDVMLADPTHLLFAVTDTGSGIEAGELTEIFAAFAQTRTGAEAGGTGLGLAISDHLIAGMGGRLEVESTVGEGSRFWFTLPLVEAAHGARPATPEHDKALPPLDAKLAAGQRFTALVVDDSAANRAILASLLESAGLTVITANGGLQALELAAVHRPSIVFMDLKMNDLDGLEVTRRLARDPATAAIPVVAVTASAFGDIRQTARDAGCVDYLSKPVRAQLLFGMLQAHLGARFVNASCPVASGEARVLEIERRVEIAARLRSAVALGDIGEIQALASGLLAGGSGATAIGERINRLASQFDFDGLGALADSLAAQVSS